ncbi:MAG: cyclic nucleotide-binding domain-containing protein, partial [Bellilinea sp.]
MTHTVITFLGIRPQQTTYCYEEREYQGRIFAEAILQFLPFDRMLVLTTPEAENVYSILAEKNDPRIQKISIPTGRDDGEMWGIFDRVIEHIEEGVTIYSSGDPSDSLYIINRGAVAVIHEDPRYADRADISYLSRGDMFGEIDVLTDSYRRNAIRTCEPVSLQCFRREDFPEIIRRVPSFFYFIAQRLATRFVQVTDMAFVQSHCLELSGSLENFDLVTIYQTIVNSNQTGELAVYNTLG